MMRTRCSLFTLGAFVAAFTLLASGANAQIGTVAVDATKTTYDTVTVTWSYAHGSDLSAELGLGFNVYYVKGDSASQLSTGRQIGAAMMTDAGLGDTRKMSTAVTGTDFTFKLKGLDPATKYVVTLLHYAGEPSVLAVGTIPDAATPETAAAPQPSLVRDVELMPEDKMLMVSWNPPVRAAGPATTIKLDRYEVQWRWSQTSDHAAGDWTMYPLATAPKTTKLTATMYAITGLTNDVMYDVQVRAINEAKGVSLWAPADPGVRGTPMAGGAIPTPALPLFGAFALGAGLFAAGRARLRRRAQRQLTR